MDTKQTLNIVDKYFNTIELFGNANRKDFITILYLMFIDEYYEFNRDISLRDIDNDKIGLTDCLVKSLNTSLKCLKDNSNILQGVALDYLPGKNHWIIESPDDESSDYIEGAMLNTSDTIVNQTLITTKKVINNILQL